MDGIRSNADAAGNHDTRRSAGELLAVLPAYEREVRRLRAGWDAEAFSLASLHFSRLRELSMPLAAIHAEWVEVLISRFEFTHALWQQHAQQGGAQLHEVHERHAAALRKLQLACSGRYAPRRHD